MNEIILATYLLNMLINRNELIHKGKVVRSATGTSFIVQDRDQDGDTYLVTVKAITSMVEVKEKKEIKSHAQDLIKELRAVEVIKEAEMIARDGHVS